MMSITLNFFTMEMKKNSLELNYSTNVNIKITTQPLSIKRIQLFTRRLSQFEPRVFL